MDLYPNSISKNIQYDIATKFEFRNFLNPDSLYNHQEFVRRFMSPYTPYSSLILFHDLGSGKSIACIATAVDHYLYDKKQCIIVTKGQSGTNNFLTQIQKFHTMSSTKEQWTESIFKMKHYISLHNQILTMSDEEIINNYSNTIFVLDEAHNIRFPTTAINKECVYNSFVKIIKLCHNIKMLMATATPMTDNSDQLEPMLRMCNYMRKLNDQPLSMNGIISYNPYVLDKPTSVYIGTDDNNNIIKSKTICIYKSLMKDHQLTIYQTSIQTGTPNDIYRSRTHISLFCLPDGSHGREITNKLMFKTTKTKNITPMYTNVTKKITYVQYSPTNKLLPYLSGDKLASSGCKYKTLLNILNNSTGNAFIFIEEVKGSGVLLFSSILEENGYELYVGENILRMSKNKKRYTLCIGSNEICPNIQDRLDGFNSEHNKNGDYIRIIIGSRVIGESITLCNIKQFHCLTPHWNDSIINQAIGRVVRNGSHNALDISKRNVDIYLHAAITQTNDNQDDIDIMKFNICNKKLTKIQERENEMVSMAVDKYCILQNDSIPITDFRTFSVLYIKYYIDKFTNIISNILSHSVSDTINIDKIYKKININPLVFKEMMCIIIRDNIQIEYYKNNNKYINYIRSYKNYIFAVDDPSLPYVTLSLPMLSATQIYEHDVPKVKTLDMKLVLEKYNDNVKFVQYFRYLSVKHKIIILEKCICIVYDNKDVDITTKAKTILSYISTLFVIIDKCIYHLLWYRDLESSYTTSIPVPKKPSGKTRVFINNNWQNLNTDDEITLFEEYKKLYLEQIKLVDIYDIFGVISTIDGDMRLRLRDLENFEMSTRDQRYIRRGKNLKSIKKDSLLMIASYININNIHNKNRSYIIEQIDKYLLDNMLFIII